MGHRSAKKCHNSIAGELVDRPLMPVDFIHQHLKAPIHDLMNFFRVDFLRHRGIVGHISKQHRHQLPLPFDRTSVIEDLISQEFRGIGLWVAVCI